MGHRWRGLSGLVLGVAVGGVTGCSSPATAPSGPSSGAPGPAVAGTAFTTAVTKLGYIAQDSCQRGDPTEVYPNCSRYLAELGSATATVRSGADGLPNATAVRETSDALTAAMNTFTAHNCVTAAPAGGEDPQTCAADLLHIRTDLSALINQTAPAPSPARPAR